MRDEAAEETDILLAKLEKKISSEYKGAYDAAEEKWQKFLSSFEKQDKIEAQRLADGEITKQQYQQWRIRQIANGKQYEEMRNVIAQDLHKANLKAAKLANKSMADVYAVNANYGTYIVEHGGKIDTGFTLYNHDAAEDLLKKEWSISHETGRNSFLPKPSAKKQKELAGLKSTNPDVLWNSNKIQSAMFQGILLGEPLTDLAKRLASVAVMDEHQAIRNARTLTTNVQNKGRMDAFDRASNLGVELVDEWVAILDGATRHSHRHMHGERRPHDSKEPFSNGCRWPGDPQAPAAEVYNCFVPETKIASDSKIVRSYKHWYDGEVYSVETSGGVHFTCTPNHPILTPDGWVPVKFLNDGDYLIVTSGVNAEVSRRNPDINHVHPSIDTIHKFFKMSGGERTSRMGVNFHGDISTTDVEIITQKGFLKTRWNSSIAESIKKFFFKHSYSAFFSFSTFAEHFRRVWFTAFCNVCSFSKAVSFICGRLAHAKEHRFRTVSLNDAVFVKDSDDNLAATTKFFSKSLNRKPGVVFRDQIVSINVSTFHGNVYNLQTKNNYYFVNDIITQNGANCNGNFAIAHNCRCRLVSWVKGFEGETVKYNEAMGSMSFEEWQNAKAPKKKDVSVDKVAETRYNGNVENREEYFYIGRSVGAKALNYEVEDKATGEIYNFIEGQRIENVKVFAGYRSSKPLHEETIAGLIDEFPNSNPEKWQHKKGFGYLDVDGESTKAEIHWFEEENIGKCKFKVKEWLYDES